MGRPHRAPPVRQPAERSRAVVHLASFPLPEERGDFGVGVTELMRSRRRVRHAVRVRTRVARHAAVRVASGVPTLTAAMFAIAPSAANVARPGRLPAVLHRRIADRSASTSSSRAGSISARAVTQVNPLLQKLDLS